MRLRSQLAFVALVAASAPRVARADEPTRSAPPADAPASVPAEAAKAPAEPDAKPADAKPADARPADARPTDPPIPPVADSPAEQAATRSVFGPEADHDVPPLGFFPTSKDALIDPRMARSWGAHPARWFAATAVDVGFVYARPRLSLGYGKPFTSWVGVDMNPVVSGQGLGAYGGLRLELPYVDLRVGSRYFRSFTRTYLAPQRSYDRLALETESGSPSSVLTLEAELDISIPLGPGNLLARASGSYVTNVPEGMYVFEETLRVIVKPPIVWRGRTGYVIRMGKYSQHSVGLVADLLDVPARDDYRTVRVGPVVRLGLSRRVEIRGSFVTSILSPDRIGLLGGDFTELGVRYRWASE